MATDARSVRIHRRTYRAEGRHVRRRDRRRESASVRRVRLRLLRSTAVSEPGVTRPGEMSARGELRLAELVAAFSLASDLGLGQPMQHILRAWRIASRMGERIGLDDQEQVDLYYVALLAWVGCVADTYEVNSWFGDDIAFRADSYEVDLAGLPMLGFMLRHVGAGAPALHRIRLATTLVASRGQAVQQGLLSHCISTAHLADALGLGAEVREPLKQMFARWDG